jgi:phospholipase/carboxylesterase
VLWLSFFFSLSCAIKSSIGTGTQALRADKLRAIDYRKSSMKSPETLELTQGSAPEGSIIWLHGLGADGHDFEPVAAELALDRHVSLRFVFPHAPVRPVTINGGMAMRAWYDIVTLDRDGPVDEAGIRHSSELLVALVEREHERGIPYARIVLAGFSQGGAIASHTALRFPHRLAGLIALSTYVPLQRSLQDEVFRNPQAQSRELPIFMAHGAFDPMLPMALGKHAFDLLTEGGYRAEWHEYPMAHAVCGDEIADIRNWLLSVYCPERDGTTR